VSGRLTARRLGAGAGALLAASASLVAVLQFVDTKVHPAPVAVKGAEIRSVKLKDRAYPLGNFVAEIRPVEQRRYTADQLVAPGYRFVLELQAEGSPGTRLSLRWALYRVGGVRVPGAAYSQVASNFKTSASSQHLQAWPVWVPYPTTSGRYFVRFTLQDRNKRPLDQRDSRPFEHRA
jgi:hypothetical protein